MLKHGLFIQLRLSNTNCGDLINNLIKACAELEGCRTPLSQLSRVLGDMPSLDAN